ncbi:MAG: hypothetical protein CME59_16405 [Halioglobus sp.]|nr:hypothetical protein [Halioglobus sp.]|tara:strand:- start:4357 stop:4617 length:261 start_codon:yes stop_codon:yes gene_type:complete
MPQMSEAQQAAFNGANGESGATFTDLHEFVVGTLLVLMLVWLVWVSLSAYQSLRVPGTHVPDAGAKVVRALFIAIFIMAVANLEWS